MSVHCCRLYDLNTHADLILDGCSAQVLITDVHASVTLSQRFTSPGHWLNAASGVYTFGIMAHASVCGFEMIRQDGTKIEGIVKEKQEAKREYEQAVKAGHTASLGQQETGDGMINSFFSNPIMTFFRSSLFHYRRKHSPLRNCYYQLAVHPTSHG